MFAEQMNEWIPENNPFHSSSQSVHPSSWWKPHSSLLEATGARCPCITLSGLFFYPQDWHLHEWASPALSIFLARLGMQASRGAIDPLQSNTSGFGDLWIWVCLGDLGQVHLTLLNLISCPLWVVVIIKCNAPSTMQVLYKSLLLTLPWE
jgi:hypothetical protein